MAEKDKTYEFKPTEVDPFTDFMSAGAYHQQDKVNKITELEKDIADTEYNTRVLLNDPTAEAKRDERYAKIEEQHKQNTNKVNQTGATNIVINTIGFAGSAFGTASTIAGGVKLAANGAKLAVTVNNATELGLTSVTKLAENGISTVDDLIKFGVASSDDLLNIGISSMDDLAKFGVSTIDDLSNLGVKGYSSLSIYGIKGFDSLKSLNVIGVDDLVKLGITNTDDLTRYGLTSIDSFKQLSATFKFSSVDDLVKIGITSSDDLAKIGVNSIDDLTKLGLGSADDIAGMGIKTLDDFATIATKSTSEVANTANAVKETVTTVGKYKNDSLAGKYMNLLEDNKMLNIMARGGEKQLIAIKDAFTSGLKGHPVIRTIKGCLATSALTSPDWAPAVAAQMYTRHRTAELGKDFDEALETNTVLCAYVKQEASKIEDGYGKNSVVETYEQVCASFVDELNSGKITQAEFNQKLYAFNCDYSGKLVEAAAPYLEKLNFTMDQGMAITAAQAIGDNGFDVNNVKSKSSAVETSLSNNPGVEKIAQEMSEIQKRHNTKGFVGFMMSMHATIIHNVPSLAYVDAFFIKALDTVKGFFTKGLASEYKDKTISDIAKDVQSESESFFKDKERYAELEGILTDMKNKQEQGENISFANAVDTSTQAQTENQGQTDTTQKQTSQTQQQNKSANSNDLQYQTQ